MVKRDENILQHIIQYCSDIRCFVERFGQDYSIFISDRAYFNAVSMCILQIGELSNNLSEEFRAETSNEIPWADIRGTRNVVAHNYGSLDEELVWSTAINDIPMLADFCKIKLEQQTK